MNEWPSQPAVSPRRAFTLLEVMVVLTILAILGTLAVPRLVGNDKREFKLAVDKVGDLLTMYAQRHNLGQKIVGIRHDPHRNWIILMILDADGTLEDKVGGWRVDPYVQPVKLPSFMTDVDVAIIVDGDTIDTSDYPLSSEIGKDRPHIEIMLRGAGEHATLSLPPYGVAPLLSSTFGGRGVVRTRYDLDAAGRSREDW